MLSLTLASKDHGHSDALCQRHPYSSSPALPLPSQWGWAWYYSSVAQFLQVLKKPMNAIFRMAHPCLFHMNLLSQSLLLPCANWPHESSTLPVFSDSLHWISPIKYTHFKGYLCVNKSTLYMTVHQNDMHCTYKEDIKCAWQQYNMHTRCKQNYKTDRKRWRSRLLLERQKRRRKKCVFLGNLLHHHSISKYAWGCSKNKTDNW